MLEGNSDPEVILGRVQRQISSLAVSIQGTTSSSRPIEERGVGRGIFAGHPL
jgi:hypothetical protein